MATEIKIVTERFVLRPLTEHDVTERYLAWLRDNDARKYIVAASTTEKLSDLKQYVLDKTGREDVLFLGIFEKQTGLHLGNIKYEPVDSVRGDAVMGVLIGDVAYRGRGVSGEVIAASAQWLKRWRNIRRILLGVSSENLAAIRAYERVGFVAVEGGPSGDAVLMEWVL